MSTPSIAHIRHDYSLAALDESVAGDDPMLFFQKWFLEANDAQITEVNAMTLATADADGRPHARTVLLKGLEGGGFSFFTNYTSAKGHQLAEQQHVALLFFWKELERQVRVEGVALRLSDSASDAYFQARPHGSQIGAWASPQSEIITGRNVLEENYKKYELQFGSGAIPRPAHWGGYMVMPERIEFWQGRSNRMHDRVVFSRNGEQQWAKCRLAP